MLPAEIVDQIVQSLAEDADSLAACACAARRLRALARPLLFRKIRLYFPAAPTRLLNLLIDFPELISFVTSIEIHTDAIVSDNLQPLLTMFCGPPDNDDRYHGAGPLHSVTLVRVNWNFLSLLKRRARPPHSQPLQLPSIHSSRPSRRYPSQSSRSSSADHITQLYGLVHGSSPREILAHIQPFLCKIRPCLRQTRLLMV